MFNYAIKRIIRGKGLFLSLFLSVALASTLFAGILQGADVIGAKTIEQVFESAPYDIISMAPDKNITKTHISEIDEFFGPVEGVERLDYFMRTPIRLFEPGTVNTTIEGVYMVAIPDDSIFYEGLVGVDQFERGEIYFDASSADAPLFVENGTVIVEIETYLWKSPPGFENRQFTFPLADAVGVEDEEWTLFVSRYDVYLQSLFSKNDPSQKRPSYNMVLVSEETYMDIMWEIFAEQRRPVSDQFGVALISLDREGLINPWDMDGSIEAIDFINEQINSEGAEFYFTPRNFLGEMLTAIKNNSNQMKTSTMIVSLPVFFTAWYLGVTITEVMFGMRKREIGLLLTRGMNHRQILYMLLIEGLIVAIFAGFVGVFGSSLILPFVIGGIGPIEILSSISPITVGTVFAFSLILALVSLYRPAQRASQINMVEALREHATEDEDGFSVFEPLLALALGAYRTLMIYFAITVEQFRPTTSNLVINLVYSTWLGSDYLLSFIAPLLLFWGFTKLFIQYAPWYHSLLTKVAGMFVGDVSKLSALSSRRNLKRTAASTFMVALIVGYSVTVIGNVATSEDFLVSAVNTAVGADAAVWLFEGQESEQVLEKVLEVDGVQSASIEVLFTPDTSLSVIPVRGIDPLVWEETAYMPLNFAHDPDMFDAMAAIENGAFLEYGAAQALGLSVNNTMLVQTAGRTYQVRVVGFYGKFAEDNYIPSNPMMYVSHTFMEQIKERYIDQRRIVVNLDSGVDVDAMKIVLEDVDPDVQRVDVAEINQRYALDNIILSGPKQIQVLGTYFAGLVASVGIVLIISTMIRSRKKELTIMVIRGYSPRQLAITMLTEHLGMDIFAIVLGSAVGVITLYGIVNLLNNALGFIFSYRVVFPPTVLVKLGAIIGLIILSTIVPIVVAVNRISAEPDLRLEE
ncbi:MAG: ABC transporter permease [Candidatus Bathyarchaeota archaeon]